VGRQAAGITGKGIKIGVVANSCTNYKRFLGNTKVTTKTFRSDNVLEDENVDGTAPHFQKPL
jgi:hypothetical protein